MEITDIIKYFAKFPQKQGVLKNFIRTEKLIPGYADLKAYVEAIEADPLMPELTEMVISANEKEVGARIRNIDNYFMFIEYGSIIAQQPDKMRIRDINFALGVYICYHNNGRNLDSMEEALIMDNCLAKTFQLAKFMISDDNEICKHERFAESVLNFSPVEPALMYQSIGWGLTFKKANNLEL